MTEVSLAFASLGILFLWTAWREFVAKNQRDAQLLAVCGTGGVVAGALAWFV
ncbi:MAG TPA: hypothetical protein VE934_06350 [Polaromonas sp.]|uniref:hypothetical protein n=1 Tax=Polaromonas sp. TaxID=1869339 RepID=UPI002D578B3B|nr:hypothetical protein [Polaromonas sp.]HYW56559.1 hypothetical protein [Polaromonas sp.]